MFRRRKSWSNKPKNYNFQIERPEAEFFSGSVVLQVWKKTSRYNKPYHYTTISRWYTNGSKFWLSKQLYPSDMDDLREVTHKFQLSRFRK